MSVVTDHSFVQVVDVSVPATNSYCSNLSGFRCLGLFDTSRFCGCWIFTCGSLQAGLCTV